MLAIRPVTFVLLLLATPATASVTTDLAAIDQQRKACTAKDPSNAGLGECTDHAREAADKVLNRVYKDAVDKLKKSAPGQGSDDKEILKRLVASERAWIAYKGADCDLQGTSMLGGSGQGLAVADCLYTMTKARAKSLDDLFQDK